MLSVLDCQSAGQGEMELCRKLKRGKKRRKSSAGVAGIKFIDLALPSNP